MDELSSISWIDSYNSSWTREDLYLILTSGGTQYLYEKLVANGEVEGFINLNAIPGSTSKPTRKPSRWKVFDIENRKKPSPRLLPRNLSLDAGFHFKDQIDAKDFEALSSGLLEMQLKSARQLLNQAELVTLIKQKIIVFNRLAHAYRLIYQRKSKTPLRDDHQSSSMLVTRGSLASIGDPNADRVGNHALVELGLTTGLSLVFAILKQNWQQQQINPGSNLLCNEVLKTALKVLLSLPMMSLANTNSSDIGLSTLNQVNDFLMSSMNPCNIGNDMEGATLSAEILLLLALQRGKLSLILQWIHQCLLVKEKHSDMKIRSEVLRLALHHIRTIGGLTKVSIDDLSEQSLVDLDEAAKTLLTEVVIKQSSHGMLKIEMHFDISFSGAQLSNIKGVFLSMSQ